ncbi:MAG: hypothetical protein CSA55_03700 [Ilumatobacter coccineus]|uniref:Uncharacterized protein n=1 Tax=Ilumatobacter coccineus TaxID=467094 RepID=A0A2G6K9D9_9ACTN|nr:MAG: hypothetical protein CSA55_03700 [Ilumatobacter coccineus]
MTSPSTPQSSRPSRPALIRRADHWITDNFIDAHSVLESFSSAHSCEVWAGDDLVGGLHDARRRVRIHDGCAT